MKVALYARVSTDDKGQNPEAQLLQLRNISEARGYEIVAEYVDTKSGKDANRPEFQKMLEAAKMHKFDAIFSVRIDRIMRSVINLNTILLELKSYKVKLLFVDMVFDPEDPNSLLVFQFLSAIAEWERQIISKRTTEGLALAKAKGHKSGKPNRDLPLTRIAMMRMQGKGWLAISNELKIPKSTLRGRRKDIEDEVRRIESSTDMGG